MVKTALRGREQVCEACGESFTCGPALGPCWCFKEKVSAELREALKQKYGDCICQECLSRAREGP